MKHRLRHNRRGFNLVEAAIVLGVVGLVIGGIWVVASSVSTKRGINAFASDALQLFYNVQRMYPSPSTDYFWASDSQGGVAATVVPGSWTQDAATNMWQEPGFGYRPDFGVFADERRLELYVYGPPPNGTVIPKANCINLAVALIPALERAAVRGFFTVDAHAPASNYTYTFGGGGFSMSSIDAACAYGADQFIMHLYF